MKKLLPIICLMVLAITSYGQEVELNLDFENIENEKPSNWWYKDSKIYNISIDTENAQHGKNAILIEYKEGKADFSPFSWSVPATYAGEKIKLTGYIKTENVTEGYGGLWLRIDPGVSFDNMGDRGVTGTTDWQKYEIELELNPKKATKIVFGGMLVGKGKVWIDNLTLTIDGKNLAEAPLKEVITYPADEDKEFDEGSGVDIANLDDTQIENLELLGKIWGLMKYHHPMIAQGKYNWDYELFRFLPNYLQVKDSDARDNALIKWMEQYGEIPDCKDCKPAPEKAFGKPELNWIIEGAFDESLKEKLFELYENRNQGEHYYIAMHPNVGNPDFTNEKSYEKMPFPDDGFKLLAAYRLWNSVHYFFPYKHLMDKPWSKVLKEFIPHFVNAKDEFAYEMAAVKMIAHIQDTHANLWRGGEKIQEWKGKNYPNVVVKFIEKKLVVTDFYSVDKKEETGLQLGDVITHVKGKSVEAIVNESLPIYPASNLPTQLRDIAGDILRSNEDSYPISYIRDGKSANIKLKVHDTKTLDFYYWYRRDPDGQSFKMLDGNIGYVTLKNIKQDDVPEIEKAFKDTKGIVVDIRNYPSAFMVFSLGKFFTSAPSPFVKFSGGNVQNPGEFQFGEILKVGEENPDAYKGKVIVIVNEISQSQAEYTSMAFRAGDNVQIIGSTTAGADGNISRISLPGGMSTMISGIGVYYPDGKETQRIGIVPDVEVLPTIEGIKAGKDELMEKAIELIEN